MRSLSKARKRPRMGWSKYRSSNGLDASMRATLIQTLFSFIETGGPEARFEHFTNEYSEIVTKRELQKLFSALSALSARHRARPSRGTFNAGELAAQVGKRDRFVDALEVIEGY